MREASAGLPIVKCTIALTNYDIWYLSTQFFAHFYCPRLRCTLPNRPFRVPGLLSVPALHPPNTRTPAQTPFAFAANRASQVTNSHPSSIASAR